MKKSRKCKKRKSDGKCKRKPGPKSRKTKVKPGPKSRKTKSKRRKKTDVSYKISKLMKEGYSHKQSVAIALKMKEQGKLGPRGGYKKSKKKKPVKRSKKCVRGKRKSDGKCKQKPGPKRSRKKRFKMGMDILYNNEDPNIDTYREQFKNLFINEGSLLAKGTYSRIYENSTYPEWILRCTLVDKIYIPDEINITKSMLNRPGKAKNLTDIWVEPSTDDFKGKLYSITRKYAGDGKTFLESEYIKDPAIMEKFYELLLEDFKYLSDNGWACFDLKPQNILINKPDSGDDWVRLTDFGADWCKQKDILKDVIPVEYQPIFMLLLFQFNGTYHIEDKKKKDLIKDALLDFLEKNIIKKVTGTKKQMLIKGFQKIYNFFIYLLIIPDIFLEKKYLPIQDNLLHYTCIPKKNDANFTSNIKPCPTLFIIKSYFTRINDMTGNKLDMKDHITGFYIRLVNFTKLTKQSSKQSSITIYNEDLKYKFLIIVQDLGITKETVGDSDNISQMAAAAGQDEDVVEEVD